MIRRVKSINSIYENVKDYDLVITCDAPLNTALNKCLDKSIFGNFAMTVKQIKGKFCEREFLDSNFEDIDFVKLIAFNSNFNYSLKEANYYFNEIKQVFRYVCDFEKSKMYLSNDAKKILEFLKNYPVSEIVDYSKSVAVDSNLKSCVVCEEIFENSDKVILSGVEDKISIFENFDGDDKLGFDIKGEKCLLFDSKNSLINKVVSMIDESFSNNVAIVLDTNSDYLSVLKAKLINMGISINEVYNLVDNFRVREYLELLDLCFGRHNLKVFDVYAISDLFDFNLDESKKNWNYLEFVKVDSSGKKFDEFLDLVLKGTYGELFEKFTELDSNEFKLPVEFKEFLYRIGFYDKKIGDSSLSGLIDLKFYLENFDFNISQSRKGVTLVDCKNASFIDRDIIFYVGMSSDWTKDILKKDFIDEKIEFERNLTKFEILIQQGVERFYFTTEFENGEKVIPPFYFNSLIDSKVGSFEDVFGEENVYRVSFNSDDLNEKNFGLKVKDFNLLENERYLRNTLSNAKLRDFSKCPKKIAFSKLDISYDMEHFSKGNLIHSFAEVYVGNREKVLEIGIDSFADLICEQMRFISNKYRLDILRTEVYFALQAVMNFIDNLKFDFSIDELKYGESKNLGDDKNIFCEKFGLDIKYKNVEFGFSDKDIKLNGFIDLVVNLNEIVDYKTGKIKLAKDIISSSDFKTINSDCDFQALCYFAFMRKLSAGDKVFKYFHPFTNVYERFIGKNELNNEVLLVNYKDINFIDYFYSGEFFDFILDSSVNADCKKNLELIKSMDFFENLKVSDFYDWKSFYAKFENKLFKFLVDNFPKKKEETILSQTEYLLKFIFDFKNSSVRSQKEVYYFKDDLDEFEKFVLRSLDKYNEAVSSNFDYLPVEGDDTCKVCEFRAICLKKFDKKKLGGQI